MSVNKLVKNLVLAADSNFNGIVNDAWWTI